MTIYQFTPTITPGDGVSGGVLLTHELLTELGVASRIVARQIDPALSRLVESVDTLDPAPGDWLLYHHSIGHRDHDRLMTLPCRRVMVYHNITPSHFFASTPHLARACDWGREQLSSAAQFFDAAYADSEYNARELRYYGYPSPRALPLLVDTAAPLPAASPPSFGDRTVILFVGRIVTNKAQHRLIDAFYELRARGFDDALLVLVGGTSDPAYADYLRRRIVLLGLENDVLLTGKISDAELTALYARADLYLSLSLHEGFGIPLVEAMRHNVPVLGYAISAVGENLSPQGRLSRTSPDAVAQAVIDLFADPSRRVSLLRAQRERLHRYERASLLASLASFLESQGIAVPIPPAALPPASPPAWRIDGPCDSTYSLALVNRELGRALAERGGEVSFFATEGPGDYSPDRAFLASDPLILSCLDDTPRPARTVVRNLYPPRVSSMGGEVNILGPYGWEESAFPSLYAERFNRRLGGIACMSAYVARTLRANGVRVPLCVTGIGADHILAAPAAPLGFDLPEGRRLLHVSSCFPRKGFDTLLAAFDRLDFPAVLVVKTFENPHNTVRADFASFGWEERGGGRYAKGGHVALVIGEELSMAQMRTLYTACDLLVAPSRGEGFGLPLAEAMLLRLPVVTTAYGGQSDFCTPDTAWLVDYTFAPARTHMALFDSYWADPDPADLARRIRGALAGDEKRLDAAQRRIGSYYTWGAVAERLETFADAMETSTPEADAPPSLGMVTTYNVRCGIATYAHHLIRGFSRTPTIFAPRTDAPLSPDPTHVIRCFDVGRSDLDALSRAVDASGVDTLMVQFNYSLFDLPALNAFILSQTERGRRCFLTLHSTVDDAPDDKKLSLLVPAMRACTAVLVHAIADLNRLRLLGIVENALLFPHGVLDYPPPPPLPSGGPFTIATYGFFLPHKGLLEMIEALPLLRERAGDIRLMMLNARYPAPVSAHLVARARERIADLGIGDCVELCDDFLSDEESLARLSRARLIVYPYGDTGESASGAVRYGLSVRRPVAVTAIPIFDDLAGAVWHVDASSTEALADSLARLIARLGAPESGSVADRAEAWRSTHLYPRLSARLEAILTCR